MKVLNNITAIQPSNKRPEPAADITAAEATATALEAFNKLAPSRLELRHEDRSAVAEIRRCAAILRETAGRLTTRYGSNLERDSARELVEAVTRYVALVESPQSVTVAGEQISTPAIESSAIRAHIHRVGAEIVTNLEAYVDARRAAITRQEEALRNEDSALAIARQTPMLGEMITIFERLAAEMNNNPDEFSFLHTINEVPAFMHELMKTPLIAAKLPKDVTALSLIETLERQKRDEQRAAA